VSLTQPGNRRHYPIIQMSPEARTLNDAGRCFVAHDAVDRLTVLGRFFKRQVHPCPVPWNFLRRARDTPAAPFSWSAFALVQHLCAGSGGVFVFLYLPRRPEVSPDPYKRHFPYWGWLSGVLLALFWMLAWRRFTWFKPALNVTGAPPWDLLLVFCNALTFRRTTGDCLLDAKSRYLVALFPAKRSIFGVFRY